MRLLFALIVTLAATAAGYARELHWKSIDVIARLDADGELHVTERQHFVFNGDWNGGERRFNVRLGQKLRLQRLSRIEPTGDRVILTEGDMSKVDRYGWSGENVLRWRSREASAPPFENTEIVYEIEYVLSNILRTGERDGETIYILDHDFLFADRDGVVERFSLQLDIDQAWRPLTGMQQSYAAGPIPPGQSFPLEIELARVSGAPPGSVRQNAPAIIRFGVVAACVAAVAVMLMSFFALERSRHRFAREEIGRIDDGWLEQNVFFAAPEVIGALWDTNTGAAEVAAMLARLAQEKKVETKVVEKGRWSTPRLEMRLLVPRSEFSETERPLIDAFFVAGDTTSTDLIRSHYKSTGFTPSEKISGALEAAIGSHPEWADQKMTRNWWRDVLLVVAAFAFLLVAAMQGETDKVAAIIIGASGLFVIIVSSIIAASSRTAIDSLPAWAFSFTLSTAIQIAALTAFAFALVLSVLTWLALGFAVIAFYWFAIGYAPFRESLQRLRVRKRLHAARRYFEQELRKPQPALRDEWFPYIIAFGLGQNVDKWFASFGSASHRTGSTFTSSSSTAGSSGGPSGSWSGGGTSFGGAGATGAWAAAAGGLASGVASPSSSSSGGGGGSSSGGGGGGGW